MAFSSVLPFLLLNNSVDCAVHLLLCHSRALLVNSPFFLPFTALKCPFDGPFTALKCPFDGPFTVLKCPFQMAPCSFENLGRTLYALHICMILLAMAQVSFLPSPSSHYIPHNVKQLAGKSHVITVIWQQGHFPVNQPWNKRVPRILMKAQIMEYIVHGSKNCWSFVSLATSVTREIN